MQEFAEGSPEFPVLLGSGVGRAAADLHSADTVILFDTDWESSAGTQARPQWVTCEGHS